MMGVKDKVADPSFQGFSQFWVPDTEQCNAPPSFTDFSDRKHWRKTSCPFLILGYIFIIWLFCHLTFTSETFELLNTDRGGGTSVQFCMCSRGCTLIRAALRSRSN